MHTNRENRINFLYKFTNSELLYSATECILYWMKEIWKTFVYKI